jgi:hypothetical protein
MISMKLRGAEQLDRAFRALGGRQAKKALRGAVRDGAKIVAPRMAGNARSMVGGDMGNRIASAVVVRSGRGGRDAVRIRAMIDPRRADQFAHVSRGGRRHYIPGAIEYGHAAPGEAGGPKIVPAIPFARSAWTSTRRQALQTTMESTWRRVRDLARTRGR